VVQLTSPRPGEVLSGPVTIRGYAADRRSTGGSGLNEADIQLYLDDTSDEWHLFDFATGGQDSPEAAAALGPQFDHVGFQDVWQTCSFPAGPHKLIVYVSSLVQPGGRNFTTVDVNLEGCADGVGLYRDDFTARPGGVETQELAPGGTGADYVDAIFGNFAAGIDARCTEAEVPCFYALVFRGVPSPTERTGLIGYAFGVQPASGTFLLVYRAPNDDANTAKILLPLTESPAIRRGAQPNRLGVIVQDDWLRLFINGEQVGEVHDTTRPWGRVAWGAGNLSPDHNQEAQFAHFIVSTPGPPYALAAITGPDRTGENGAATASPPGAPGRVLFRDDFTARDSGWQPGAWRTFTSEGGYADGEYAVTKPAGTGATAWAWNPRRFDDFRVEVDARLVPPTDEAYVYLGFRYSSVEDNAFYAFVVDPNAQAFLLAHTEGDHTTVLIDWTASSAIQPGDARNRLGVWARGPEIGLLINGQEVGRAREDGIREGMLVLGVGQRRDGPAEARFGNLVVTDVE